MTNDLKSQISAAIKDSEQLNRVSIVETSATTAQVETVLKSFDVKNDHCDWVSWHEQDDEYLTDCWSESNGDNGAISKWRIEIKHTR